MSWRFVVMVSPSRHHHDITTSRHDISLEGRLWMMISHLLSTNWIFAKNKFILEISKISNLIFYLWILSIENEIFILTLSLNGRTQNRLERKALLSALGKSCFGEFSISSQVRSEFYPHSRWLLMSHTACMILDKIYL